MSVLPEKKKEKDEKTDAWDEPRRWRVTRTGKQSFRWFSQLQEWRARVQNFKIEMHCISKAAKRQSNNPTVPKLSGRGHPNSQESHVRRVKKGGRPLQLAAVYCMPHPFPADNINLSNSMIFIPNCSTRKIVFVSFKIKQRHRTSLGIKDIEICQPSNLPAANSPSWAGAKSHMQIGASI